MSKRVIVIGGGIIGLCSAYYLHKEGYQITVIDQSNMDEGASYVNAGYLSPSHIIPLAAPGVMKQGLKWMLNTSSPLYIKPRLDIHFLKWVWAFNKACNPKHVERAIPVIRDIAVWSQELYDDIKSEEGFSFHYDKKGLLMLCQTEKVMEAEVRLAKMAQETGLEASVLSNKKLNELEPGVVMNTIGAVYFKCDYHTTPNEFMEEMKTFLQHAGVQLITNEKIVDVDFKGKRISALKSVTTTYTADEYVLASGAWSSMLSKKLGIHLLVEAGKGYRINTKQKTGITIPSILTEAKVAVTPMRGFTRFGGTMEIAGINNTINRIRVDAIAEAVTRYYPEIHLTENEKENVALGLRPVSFDGLPYIGKSPKCENLTIATGHAMMGWSMATATGKLVEEIVSEKKPTLNLNMFRISR